MCTNMSPFWSVPLQHEGDIWKKIPFRHNWNIMLIYNLHQLHIILIWKISWCRRILRSHTLTYVFSNETFGTVSLSCALMRYMHMRESVWNQFMKNVYCITNDISFSLQDDHRWFIFDVLIWHTSIFSFSSCHMAFLSNTITSIVLFFFMADPANVCR